MQIYYYAKFSKSAKYLALRAITEAASVGKRRIRHRRVKTAGFSARMAWKTFTHAWPNVFLDRALSTAFAATEELAYLEDHVVVGVRSGKVHVVDARSAEDQAARLLFGPCGLFEGVADGA